MEQGLWEFLFPPLEKGRVREGIDCGTPELN